VDAPAHPSHCAKPAGSPASSPSPPRGLRAPPSPRGRAPGTPGPERPAEGERTRRALALPCRIAVISSESRAGPGAVRARAWAGRAGGFAKGMARMPAGPASESARGPRRGGPLRGRAEAPAERIRASAGTVEAAPAGPRARAGPGRALAPETRRLDRSRQLPDTRTAQPG